MMADETLAVFRVCTGCFDALQEGISRTTHDPCEVEWCDCCHPVMADDAVG